MDSQTESSANAAGSNGLAHASIDPAFPLILVQLQTRMARKLKIFRKLTGLTPVASFANSIPELGTQSVLAPPLHPQCARRIQKLRTTPCGDHWLAHLKKSRGSPSTHVHLCPIGMRCACVPIHFSDRLVGVAKLVAAPSTSESVFTAGIGVLELIVSETCLELAVTQLTEQVHGLKRRVGGLVQISTGIGLVSDRKARKTKPRGPNGAEGQRITLANSVLAYLQSHYQNQSLSLPAVAAALGYNPRYLTTSFTQVVGESMHTYLLVLRVTHACRLLIDTDLRVKEIAYDSGFSSSERLGVAFRRHVGISPLEYRRVFSSAI